MGKKLNCVLLIDDDEPTNFYHEMIIKQSGLVDKIVVVENGQDGLDYLVSKEGGKHPQPDLIFLDINMPAMNGWEFLEHYKELDKNQQANIVVVMLTSSLNPDDKSKAGEIGKVKAFLNKPLSLDSFQKIVEEHFPGYQS